MSATIGRIARKSVDGSDEFLKGPMSLKRCDGAKEHSAVSAVANGIDANKYENEKRMKKASTR